MAIPILSHEFSPDAGRPHLELVDDIEIRPLEIEVESRKEIGTSRKIDGGSTQRYLYSLSDGSKHEAVLSRPKRQKYGRAVLSGTMWWTGVEGYNKGWGKYSVEKGMSSVVVGAEVGSLSRAIRQIGNVSLVREALVQFAVHDDLATEGEFMDKEFVGVDYSRSGAIRQISRVIAPEHGFRIPYSEVLDSALLSRVSWGNIDPKQIAPYVLKEAGALKKGIAASPVRSAGRLFRTFPISPQALVQGIGTGLALGSGQAEEIVELTPHETVGSMWYFGGSKLSRHREATERYKEHPYMQVRIEPGYHLTGSNPFWQKRLIGNTALVQQELKQDVSPQDIDIDAVHKKVDVRLRKGRF